MFKKRSLVLLTSLCLLGSVSSCTTFFGSDSFMIKSYNITKEENGDQILTIIFDDEDQAPMVIKIPKGISGENGVGIESVVPTKSEDGTQVTITITYTDKTIKPTVISVPLIQGNDGVSVTGVDVKTDEKTGNIVIKFKYSNDTESDEIVIPKGIDGKDGNGIKSMVPNYDEETNITTITVTFTDETLAPVTFEVKNGQDGAQVSSMKYNEEKSTEDFYVITVTYSDDYKEDISFPRPKTTKWLSSANSPTNSLGNDGDFFLNESTGDVYKKINGNWSLLFSMKGTGSTTVLNVTFDINGGEWTYTSADDNKETRTLTCDYGEYFKLDNPRLEVYKTGYTFTGWWTDKDASINPNAGHLTSLTPIYKDLVLYANWKANA